MAERREGTVTHWRARLVAHWGHAQHRNAYYLILNNVTGAAAGLVFWFIFARLLGLPDAQIGLGYATVALGTTIGVVAKGGWDTAIVRNVPGANHKEGGRLLGFAIFFGVLAALVMTLGLAFLAGFINLSRPPDTGSWFLVAAVGALLVITWLQDAYFLAEGDAKFSFERNLVLSGARLLLPLPIVALALPHPVALTWALALAASAVVATGFARAIPHREGRVVPRREFLRSAARNVTGSASEFLPGLLLAPLVLAINGPDSAAHFGMAWTAASILFLASAAISRSTLAEMVRNGPEHQARAIQRSIRQHVRLVAPAALIGAALAPIALGLFGSNYAHEGALAMAILCASIVFVAPSYLYLAVLRAHERALPLMVFPAAMIAALFVLAPLLEERWGLAGVALAWLLANIPFGLYAMLRLRQESREVTLHEPTAPTLPGAPHLE